MIRNDRHNIRNGFVFYRFDSEDDIKKKLSCCFDDFHFGSVEMSLFGDDKEFDHTIGWCINRK